MKCKFSVDEVWPIYFIDKVDSSEKNQPYETEIPDDLYSEYIWISLRYSLLQQKLKRHYDECTRRIIEESPRRFKEGCIIEKYSFNEIHKASKP